MSLEFKYVVKEDSPFEGYVEMKLLSHMEKVKLSKGMIFKLGTDGKTSSTTDIDISDMNERLYPIMKSHIVSLDLKLKKSGREFKTVEDLELIGCYSDGSSLIYELIGFIQSGPSLDLI